MRIGIGMIGEGGRTSILLLWACISNGHSEGVCQCAIRDMGKVDTTRIISEHGVAG